MRAVYTLREVGRVLQPYTRKIANGCIHFALNAHSFCTISANLEADQDKIYYNFAKSSEVKQIFNNIRFMLFLFVNEPNECS